MRVPAFSLLALVSILGLTAGSAWGDVIHRRNGPPLEGKIILESPTKIVLKTRFGKVEIRRADVLRVERGKTAVEMLEERRKRLPPDDLKSHLTLADWAMKNGLRSHALTLYRHVLTLDPANETANRNLGRVKYQGAWYTEEQLDRIKKAEEEERKRESGLIKFEGRWMTPRERGRLLRERRREERRLRKDQAIADEVERKLGRRPVVVSTLRFRIISMYEQEEAKGLLRLAEQAHQLFTSLAKHRPDCRYWRDTADEFILNEHGQLVPFIEEFVKPRRSTSRKYLELCLERHFWISSFPPSSAYVRPFYPPRNALLDNIAYYLLDNSIGRKNQSRPAWLYEGFTDYLEVKLEGVSRCHRVGLRQYGGSNELADKASDGRCWPELVKDSVVKGTHTPFVKLKHILLNQLDLEHLSKSWSLMTFLIDEHPDEFARWMKHMREMQWERALFKAYHLTDDELDRAWERWVKATY